MMLILSGCAGIEKRLDGAAVAQGVTHARVTLPELPDDCRAAERHAEVVGGAELRSILKREQAALDRANDRVTRCAANYDAIKDGLR